MSETTTTDTTDAVTTDTTTDEGTKPDTDELGEGGVKALKAEREARATAEKVSADLAKELKAIKDKDKTEAERQQEELDTARRELEEVTAAKTRAEVAADKSVPIALLAGPASTSAADIGKYADALIAFRGTQGSNRLHVPNEGQTPTKQANDEHEFVSQLFGT